MARLISDGASRIDFSHFASDTLAAATVIGHSSTTFSLALYAGITLHFTGVNLVYNSDNLPISGTITGLEERLNSVTVYRIVDMADSIGPIYDYIINNRGAFSILAGNDSFMGSVADDVLTGANGDDYLLGGAGGDYLFGGSGNDHLYGQSANGGTDGADEIDGWTGNDYIQGNAGDDQLRGGAGSDRIQGGAGNDLIWETDSGFADVDGNDTINGNKGNDTIISGKGDDFVRGGQDNDEIVSGDGNDTLVGDLGDDRLSGGGGYDLFTGGGGADRFRLGDDRNGDIDGAAYTTIGPDAYRMDVITDFTPGLDRVYIGNVDRIVVGTATDVRSAEMFPHASGTTVSAVQVGADTYIFYHDSFHHSAAVLLLQVTAATLAITDFAA